MIAVSVYFLAMSAFNVIDMYHRTSPPSVEDGPFVSVMIPARNEEENIERCINSLLNQTYNDYEILVINDNSTDSTQQILERLAAENERVHVYNGKELPHNWFGKPFALQQLSEKAKGQIFLFTDSDTVHNRESVSWAVTNMQTNNADFISGYVGQKLVTFGERITVPVIFFLTGFVIPMFLNKIVKSGYFAAAVGQYIVIKRDVFLASGGFEPIKKKTSEDIYMARYIKSRGYKTEFLDITDQVSCRMYKSCFEGVCGIGKNIYDFLGKNPALLLMIAALIFLFFFLPFPLLIKSIVTDNVFLPQLIAVNILFTLTWTVLFLGRKIKWYNAFLWPFLYCTLFYMVIWSFYRTVTGRGFFWKGRVVT
jgi:chlorobactene glucosyltransferase